MYQGTGKLVYDPRRGDLKKKPHDWCVIEVDREITRYFRYWVDKHVLNPLGLDKQGLAQPSWNAHISIVRGTLDLRHATNPDAWKKYQGEIVPFDYSPEVRQTTSKKDGTDDYWFVDVICPRALEIRKELGLRTDYGLHLTIGRTWQ